MEDDLTFDEAVMRLKTMFNPHDINHYEINEIMSSIPISEKLANFYQTNGDTILKDIIIGLAKNSGSQNFFFSYLIAYDDNFVDARNIGYLVTQDLIKLLNIPVGCCAVPSILTNYYGDGQYQQLSVIEINVMLSELYT